MAEISEKQLKAQIKSKEYSNAYFIYGEETYLKSYYVSVMKSKIVDKAFSDFNLHIFEGKDSSIDDIINDAEVLPMMNEYNLVVVGDYPFNESSDDCDKIKKFIKDIPDTTIMIFYFDTIKVDPKKNSKWKSLIKAFSAAGSSVLLNKRSQGDIVKLVQSGAKKRGTVISSTNAFYLISVVGTDMTTVLNELEKLSMFVGEGEITKDIIDNMATKCLQARVYDLSKEVVKGNATGAYNVLETLFALKSDPIQIIAVLGGCYVDMYRVKCARTASMDATDVAQYYNYRGREFTLNNALRDGRNLSMPQLRRAIDEIVDSDIKLKSTSIDGRLILEETIIKLLLITKEEG